MKLLNFGYLCPWASYFILHSLKNNLKIICYLTFHYYISNSFLCTIQYQISKINLNFDIFYALYFFLFFPDNFLLFMKILYIYKMKCIPVLLLISWEFSMTKLVLPSCAWACAHGDLPASLVREWFSFPWLFITGQYLLSMRWAEIASLPCMWNFSWFDPWQFLCK